MSDDDDIVGVVRGTLLPTLVIVVTMCPAFSLPINTIDACSRSLSFVGSLLSFRASRTGQQLCVGSPNSDTGLSPVRALN